MVEAAIQTLLGLRRETAESGSNARSARSRKRKRKYCTEESPYGYPKRGHSKGTSSRNLAIFASGKAGVAPIHRREVFEGAPLSTFAARGANLSGRCVFAGGAQTLQTYHEIVYAKQPLDLLRTFSRLKYAHTLDEQEKQTPLYSTGPPTNPVTSDIRL